MEARNDGEQKFQIVAALFVIAVISLSVIFFLNSYIATENNRYLVTASPINKNYLNNLYNESSQQAVEGATVLGEKDLVCIDCKYFPVNKENSLDKTFTPTDIVPINLTGGGSVTKETLNNLKDLFNDASKEGIDIKVVSSYRSYNTQIGTFNYWVGLEKDKGLSQSEAENKANNYSARAGHSEHQLGTTIDLTCKNCNSFDNSSGNLKVYSFLEENAYKYGFVISYPKGKESLTGYKYEPWHIRYIGIDLATEFYDMGYLNDSYNYLAKFLLDKQLWN